MNFTEFLTVEGFDLNRKTGSILLIFSILALVSVLTVNANMGSVSQIPDLGCLCGESGENFSGEIDCHSHNRSFVLHLGLGYFTYDCEVTEVTVCEEEEQIDEYYRDDDCDLEFQFINF